MTAPDWLAHPAVPLSVGGAAGTNARYWLGRAVAAVQGGAAFPWATFLINVAGSAALGVAAAACLGHPDPARRNLRRVHHVLDVQPGDAGAAAGRAAGAAAGYAVGSVACGLLAVWLAKRCVEC